MANKIVAVFLMFAIVVAAVQVSEATVGQVDVFKTCFTSCHDECKAEGHGFSFCEVKCDEDCTAKEIAAKLNQPLP